MQKPDTADRDCLGEYLEKLCGQVRCKRAHEGLRREMADHLRDQKAAYEAEGIPSEEALARAVESMGDPVEVGQQMDRIHRPRPNWGAFALTAVLLILGAMVQGAVTAAVHSLPETVENPYRYLLFAGIGLLLMMGCYFLDYSILGKHPNGVCVLFLAGCLAAAMFLGLDWGNPGYALSRQILLVYPILHVAVIWRQHNRGGWGFFVSVILWLLGILGGMLLGSVVVVLMIAFVGLAFLVWAAWKKWFGISRPRAILVLPAVVSIGFLLFCALLGMSPVGFFQSLMHHLLPSVDPEGSGWIVLQVQKLLSQAHLVGAVPDAAFGEMQTLERSLPMWRDSLVLTWVICKFGWLAGLLILLALAGLLVWMMLSARKLSGSLGQMTAWVCTMVLGIQFLGFLAVNLGILPNTGNGFPFVTGEIHLVVTMGVMGVFLSCCRGRDLLRESALSAQDGKHVRPKWLNGLPSIEIRVNPPQYNRGEIKQMLGLVPPPKDTDSE